VRPVSDTFLKTLRGSHLIDGELELQFPPQPGAGGTIVSSPVTRSGTVYRNQVAVDVDTTGLSPLMPVSGTGVHPDCVVAFIDSPTRLRLTHPVTIAPVTKYPCTTWQSDPWWRLPNLVDVTIGETITGYSWLGNVEEGHGAYETIIELSPPDLMRVTPYHNHPGGSHELGNLTLQVTRASTTLSLTFDPAPPVPPAPPPIVVAPVSGSITIDRLAQVRRTGTVEIPWSLEHAAQLGGIDVRTLPLGGYVTARRGIRYPDGTRELVNVGKLRVESVTWGTTERRAQIELADRMAQVRDEAFEVPFVASGMRVALAAKAIVEQVFGTAIMYDIRYDPPTVLADVIYSGSRVDAIFELATAIGAEAYFDAEGDFVFDVASGGRAVTQLGNLTDNSAVVTGLASTANLVVGMTVVGIGIPPARRIASIQSSSQITLNAPVNLYGIKNSRTEVGSNVLKEITDTDDLSPGMSVVGTGVPAGAVIVAIAPAEVTISQPATLDGYPLVEYFASSPATITCAGGSAAYPVWQVDAGEPSGVLVASAESLDRSRIANGVLIQGQATAVTPAFTTLVVDSETMSPTRWGGPVGKALHVEQSNAIQTAAQAELVAAAILNESLGLSRSLELIAAPNPALEAGDTVRVVFGDGRDEIHLLDIVRVALGTDAIGLFTRTTTTPGREPGTTTTKQFIGEDVWRELRDRPVVERVRERVS
jgi:Domain of unknown function (DUF5047)